MEVYVNPKDFISAQVVSTRDITSGLWNDWFTGTLNSSCFTLSQSVAVTSKCDVVLNFEPLLLYPVSSKT